MVPLARRNLFAETGRLLMSVGGVAFAVILILVVVSLYRGWSEASGLFAELPGEVWIAQQGTSDPLRTTSHLPRASRTDLERLPGVAAAVPVYARRIALRGSPGKANVFFMGLDVPRRLPVSAEVRARFLPAEGRVVVDNVLAREADVGVGEAIDVLGRRLVVDRVEPGGNPLFELAFVSGADAPALLGLDDYVSFFLLATEPGADVARVAREASAAVPGSEAHTSAEFAGAMRELVDQGFLPVVGALVAIGLGIGGAVIALTTYTATIEKARDYGVLKALGASNGFVYRIVVIQSLIVGTTGAVLGVAASALLSSLIRERVPEFVTDLRPSDAAGVLVAAVLVSLAAAFVPVQRINRIDPAIVFRA